MDQLSSVMLQKGKYIFEGLVGADEGIVAIVSVHHDVELDGGRRITYEIGPINWSESVLLDSDVDRVLVSIYPCQVLRYAIEQG